MNSENLLLNGKNFTEDIFKALRLIRHEKDFTDVTLVCKDDMLVRAHRVILASASSFARVSNRLSIAANISSTEIAPSVLQLPEVRVQVDLQHLVVAPTASV